MQKHLRLSEFVGKHVALYLRATHESATKNYQKFRGTIHHGQEGEMFLHGKSLTVYFWHGDFHLPPTSGEGENIKIQSVLLGSFAGGLLLESEEGAYILLDPEGEERSFSSEEVLGILIVGLQQEE